MTRHTPKHRTLWPFKVSLLCLCFMGVLPSLALTASAPESALTIKGMSPEELKAVEQEATRQAQKVKSPDASTMGSVAPPTSPAGPSLPPSTHDQKPEEENTELKPLRSGSKTYPRQSYKSHTLKPGYAIQSTPAERAFGK